MHRLGFGTLTLAACQKNASGAEAADLFAYAAARGINWFDTAEYYGNYDQLAPFLASAVREDVFISSKSYAYDAPGMRRSLDLARRALGVDTIDLFMLHEQESDRTLAGHAAAFRTLIEARERGIVRYIGVSTHAIRVVRAMADAKWGRGPADPAFDTGIYREADAVFALLSATGIGLLDGTAAEMHAACADAAAAGLGVLGMKLFGGGHLLGNREEAVAAALAKRYVAAWSVGMASQAEIETNLVWLDGGSPPETSLRASAATARQLRVTSDCTRCGRCVERCRSGAMSLGAETAVCDASTCTLCSYCAYVCRDFAIKVY